jgi:hypothetical protein
VALEYGAQCNFQSARMRSPTGIGNRHTVRDYKDACQYLSSQLRDKRIALEIRPAIE